MFDSIPQYVLAFAMIFSASALLSVHQRKIKVIENGAVAIRAGLIVDVGPAKTVIAKYPFYTVCSLGNSVLMPGLVNAHVHLELPPLLNTIRAHSLPDWILNLLRAKKKITAERYIDQTKRNIESIIQSGTTMVAEICTHNASPHPLIHSGIRAVIFQEVISMNPSGSFPIISLSNRSHSSRVQTGISPHAPHTVSPNVLEGLRKRYPRMHFSMHVAESRDEIKLLQGKKSGYEKVYTMAGWDVDWAPKADTPFQYLQRLGMLGPRFTAVHAVHATNDDIRLIKKTGTGIVHCPRSNKETGVGKMKLKLFRDAGIPVGLGTDSLASSPSLNMWDEMRFAYRLHRHAGVSASDIIDLATRSGARALGLDAVIGTLEPGKRADIIAVPAPKKRTGDLCFDLIRDTRDSIMTMVDGNLLWIDRKKMDRACDKRLRHTISPR